uniref:Uncharacterized protein n=1 Tax=Anguilla anguilla TaxID=7936 RepID=A0A0E9VZP3_ANGAN
MSNLYYMHDI